MKAGSNLIAGMLHFGRYIQELRIKKGRDLQDVASYLEITPALLSKVEKGRVNATKAQVFQLAGYFGVDTKEMLIIYQRGRIIAETKDSHKTESLPAGKAKSCLTRNRGIASRRYQHMIHTLSKLRESQLQVKLYKPAYPLNLYIDNILYCKEHQLDHTFEKILPDGGVQLVITLDGYERRLMSDSKKEASHSLKNTWVAGIQRQYLTYQIQQSKAALYIHFHPGGFYALTQIPQSAIENTIIEADLLLGSSILRLREEMLRYTEAGAIFQLAERYFSAKMSQQHIAHAVISYVCEHIHWPLSLLVQKTGYSQKHLIQLFKKHVGVTPKYFQRISRFNRVLNHMHTTAETVDWSAIAFDHHYYDQAHFIREFSHFTGMRPQDYLATGSTCAKVMHTHTCR